VDRPGVLPNFLIIGAARCGTTNFASYLRAQPGVFLAAKRPEPHYFLKDWEYEKGLGYYSTTYFSRATDETAIGEASASYLCHRKVAERVRADLPGVRLVAMLRNPIPRAYSGYWHTVRNGFETLSFLDALKAEPARAAAATDPVAATIRTFAYIERGLYARQLRTFLEYFSRDQLHVVLFDDFVADPKGETCAALQFLGVDPAGYVEPAAADMDVNHSTPGDRWMDEAAFQFLRAAYRDEVHDLSNLLGRDLSRWLDTATDAAPVYAAARKAA
jgi:Sulfotransferase domain